MAMVSCHSLQIQREHSVRRQIEEAFGIVCTVTEHYQGANVNYLYACAYFDAKGARLAYGKSIPELIECLKLQLVVARLKQ